MTLQQLRYVIAVNKFRSFAKAAEHCDVTQPTLSKMIANLEDELDVRLFERNNKLVVPTALGVKIISQSEKAVMEVERIREIVEETKSELIGDLRLSVGPSIAPYILPEFIRIFGTNYPGVSLTVEEIRLDNMFDALLSGRTDIAISIGGNKRDNIFEIPLYNEPFWVYLAESCLGKLPEFTPHMLSHESMWVMKEAQCLRESAFSFCKARESGRRIYEAGNIETLVRVVDSNGGFTIIPEMHLPLLSESQRRNVRPLNGDSKSMRRVSLYIRHDYVREKMLNSVVETVKDIVPSHMIDSYLKNGSVKL